MDTKLPSVSISADASSTPKEENLRKKICMIDLPSYQSPKTGFLAWLPSGLVPYAQLMRIEKPHGYYTFLFPHMYGLLWATVALHPSNTCFTTIPTSFHSMSSLFGLFSLAKLVYPVGWFTLGSILLRGAACSWNDTIDAPFDRMVARCRHRPVARGAVSTAQAHTFTLLQSVIGCMVLAQLPDPARCTVYAVPLVILIGLYPFAKRFTDYPQVMLGFALACGQLVGATAAISSMKLEGGTESQGLDILSEFDGTRSRTEMRWAVASFFGANILSAVIVDTVYAHQDLQDDIKAGLKSTAILWQERTKVVLSVLSIAKVTLLALGGIFMNLHAIYYTVTVGGTAIVLGMMVWMVDLRNAENCGMWFRKSILWSGLAFIFGLCGELIQLSTQT